MTLDLTEANQKTTYVSERCEIETTCSHYSSVTFATFETYGVGIRSPHSCKMSSYYVASPCYVGCHMGEGDHNSESQSWSADEANPTLGQSRGDHPICCVFPGPIPCNTKTGVIWSLPAILSFLTATIQKLRTPISNLYVASVEGVPCLRLGDRERAKHHLTPAPLSTSYMVMWETYQYQDGGRWREQC
jgi:hypothetical protein